MPGLRKIVKKEHRKYHLIFLFTLLFIHIILLIYVFYLIGLPFTTDIIVTILIIKSIDLVIYIIKIIIKLIKGRSNHDRSL